MTSSRMRARLVPCATCCCLLALFPDPGLSQQAETLTIHTRRISERVLVIWPGDYAQTTTMIAIASERGIVVVDTESSWSLTEEIKGVIEREFLRDDFAYLINTHGHSDHGGGNQVFGDAVIIAHDRCPELLRSALHDDNLEYRRERLSQWLGRLDQQLRSLPENDPDSLSTEEQTRYLRRIVADLGSGFELTLPQVTFSDRLTLDLGDMTLRIYYFGGLHTDDHVVAHIPEEALLLVGDILNDSWIPVLSESDDIDFPRMLTHWETVQQQEAELQHIVNGHWDLSVSLAHFRQAYQYVRTLWEEVQFARSEGVELQQIYSRLSLRDRFPAFRELVYEYDGINYHHRNIELIWNHFAGR